MKRTSFAMVGLSGFTAFAFLTGSCEAKENKTPLPNAEAVGAPAPAPAAAPAPIPVTTVPVSASEAERSLAQSFIEKFLAAIEANDAAAWPALHVRARREALIANDAIDKSYEAWRKGTLTAIPHIRAAEFALQKTGEHFTLRFVGVKVPTDPETEYSMAISIEDGEMRISEK